MTSGPVSSDFVVHLGEPTITTEEQLTGRLRWKAGILEQEWAIITITSFPQLVGSSVRDGMRTEWRPVSEEP